MSVLPDPTGQPTVTTEGTGTPDASSTAYNNADVFDFDEAFADAGQSAAAVPAPTDPAGDSGQPSPAGASTSDGTTTTAAPAQPEQTTGGSAPTSTPEPSTPGEPSEPGRRQSARERDEAEKAELRAIATQAVADAEEAKRVADAAKADQEARTAQERQSAEQYAKLIGPEDEYQRRTRISNLMRDPYYSGERLDDEQVEELGKWTATRELRQPFMDDSSRTAAQWVTEQLDGQRQTWVRQALTVADEIGLPRDVLANPANADLAVLLKTTAESTAARIRAAEVKPLQDRISQLEGYASGLETTVVHGQRTPPIGGNSDGGLIPSTGQSWNPDVPWDANFAGSPAGSRS